MKKNATIVSLFFVVVFCSCASKVVSPVSWTFQKEGIVLRLYAKGPWNDKAASLDVFVCQLGSPAFFNRLIGEEGGLDRIVKGLALDGRVLSVKRMEVLPASEGTYKIDRVEGASHVGVVAGYPVKEGQHAARLYEVPLFVKKEGFFSSAGELVPGSLDIEVVLGPYGVEEREAVALKKAGGACRD